MLNAQCLMFNVINIESTDYYLFTIVDLKGRRIEEKKSIQFHLFENEVRKEAGWLNRNNNNNNNNSSPLESKVCD